ncbi:MAG: twin-arginine translocation signal domain-containing protein [Limisphaerales bacterium]
MNRRAFLRTSSAAAGAAFQLG